MKTDLVIFQWWHPSIRPDKSNDNYWDSMIHKDDLQIAYDNKFKSNIFCVTGQEKEFIVLKQGDSSLRVKNECLTHINYEGFYLGDKINVLSKNEKNIVHVGYIENLSYHFKEKRLSYFLTDLDNKKLTKRYFSDDIEKANVANP